LDAVPHRYVVSVDFSTKNSIYPTMHGCFWLKVDGIGLSSCGEHFGWMLVTTPSAALMWTVSHRVQSIYTQICDSVQFCDDVISIF